MTRRLRSPWLGGVALTIALASCSSSSSQADPHNEAPVPAGGKSGNGAAVSSSFKQALQRFTTEVASTYGKRAADLKILPASEDVVGFDDQNTGDLIGFEATAPSLRVRGFASKSAVVLAKKGEFGPLLQAAHALDAKASLSAQDLAARIVWLIGPDTKLVANVADYPRYPVPDKVAPPAIERNAGGAVLHFYYIQFDSHLPGAPPTPFRAEVKCSPNYQATLVTSPGP
jgi:hypothetical protein